QIVFWTIYWLVELLMYSLSFSGFLNNKNLFIESIINLFIGTLFFYSLIYILPIKEKHIDLPIILGRSLVIIIVIVLLRYILIQLSVVWSNFKSPLVSNLFFFGVSSFDIFSRYGIYAALVWFFKRQGFLQNQIL